MADTMAPPHGDAAPGETRRDFLKLSTAAFAAVGVGAVAWPFVSSMNPARDVLALASTEVDLTPIASGQAVTRGPMNLSGDLIGDATTYSGLHSTTGTR
jgi:ubiquinol-cytochrome c reductase iron-sulfur subunit